MLLLQREFSSQSFDTDDTSMLQYRKKICYRIITFQYLFKVVRPDWHPPTRTRKKDSPKLIKNSYIVHDDSDVSDLDDSAD